MTKKENERRDDSGREKAEDKQIEKNIRQSIERPWREKPRPNTIDQYTPRENDERPPPKK